MIFQNDISKLFLFSFNQDDIEQIVAQIEEEERKRQETVIKTVPPPSPRGNFSFTAHPTKDELILFGGEYFNGQKVRISIIDTFYCECIRNSFRQI